MHTEEQLQMLRFATQHDWGSDARLVDGGIRVGCEAHHPERGWFREFAVIRSMRALRVWAGY